MAVTQRPPVVRTISVEQAVGELRQKVARYERIYEVPSADMLAALTRGTRDETAEIASWMVMCHHLRQLLQPPK